MRTRAGIIGAALAAGAVAAGEWRVERALTGECPEGGTVAAVALDEHAFANSQEGFADVRILDSEGREVPRVIEARRAYGVETRHTEREATLKSLEALPDGGLAVVCALERTNAVSLTGVTLHSPLRDYEQTVTVYVSEGEWAWRWIKGPEPLFDYSRYADVRKTSVELPALTNRLLKLVIGRADDKVFSNFTSLTEESAGSAAAHRQFKRYSVEERPFRIDAVSFRDSERVAVPKEETLARAAARAESVKEDAARKETVLTIPAGRWPVRGLAFAPEQQNFERRVTVERADNGGWTAAGGGVLLRSRLPGLPAREALEVRFGEVREERLRARIANDDNPPLTFGPEPGVTLLRPVYEAVFIAEKGQRYRLVYGRPEVAEAPVYERGVTAYLRGGRQAAAWSLAPAPAGEVAYGREVQVRQWLARHGMALLCAAVMAALALLILKAARHAGTR